MGGWLTLPQVEPPTVLDDLEATATVKSAVKSATTLRLVALGHVRATGGWT